MKCCKHLLKFLLIIFLSPNSIYAQQGFFLNDWQPKNITVTEFTDVAKPGATAGVTVTVDAGNVITKVPKHLFGNNSNLWMGQIVTEVDLMKYITDLSPNLIRAPGGSISDVYFWNAVNQKPADAPDSLMDANGIKTPSGFWYGGNTAGWTFSLNNYYNLLQQSNSKGIITINYAYARYGTGPNPVSAAAHLAADWVRFDNGRTKFWEIGNENGGSWEAGYRIDLSKNQDGQPEFISGTLYGQHFKVFADSMRAAAQQVGSTIYIGAQLVEHAPASWESPITHNWNSGVIAQVNSAADFYIVHNYYTPFNTNSTASALLDSASSVTTGMMNYVTQNITANGGSIKPIALTEWNTFATGSMQNVSHIAGMSAAITLGELMKNKYGQASRWDLANGWDNGNDHGMFNQGDEPGGIPKWNPRPAFYHMYYFQKYVGDEMINATVSGNNQVLSYASTFGSGQVGLALINKSLTSQTVKVNFQNFTPGNRYYWYTLTGSNDNGEFSRMVSVNSIPPTNASGGPLTYATLKPNSALSNNDVKVTLPARSAIYMLVERNTTPTGTPDIDPADKLVQLLNNPSRGGDFTLRFNGFGPGDHFTIDVINSIGQVIHSESSGYTQVLNINKQLPSGVYFIKVKMKKGTTVKKLIVN